MPLIDYDQLNTAYLRDSFYSIQLEVGDKCYQGCIYCYMNALTETVNVLSDEMIQAILNDAHDLGIAAIEWLGGEPLLRKNIFELMHQAADLGFRNNMWTGGLPFANLEIVEKTADLCKFGLISVHLSTLDAHLYEIMHPNRTSKDIDIILKGIDHLIGIGYPSEQILNSVTFTGLQPAEDLIKTMEFFDEKFGIQTSLNVFHTYLRPGVHQSELEKFIPARSEVAKVYNRYKEFLNVDQLPMNCVNKQYCSATVAVLNTGYVTPCATIREEVENCNLQQHSFKFILNSERNAINLKEFKEKSHLPEDCQKCGLNDECWGCRSRAFAAEKGIYGKDPRCFRGPRRSNP